MTTVRHLGFDGRVFRSPEYEVLFITVQHVYAIDAAVLIICLNSF